MIARVVLGDEERIYEFVLVDPDSAPEPCEDEALGLRDLCGRRSQCHLQRTRLDLGQVHASTVVPEAVALP